MHFSIKVSQETVPISAAPEILRVIACGGEDYLRERDRFLNDFPQFGFRYQPVVHDYYMMLSGLNACDLSFIVMNDTMPVVFCTLVIESVNGCLQASYSGGAGTPLPLFHPKLGENQRRSLEKFVFERCIAILREYSVKRWFTYCDGVSDDHDRLEDLLPARFGALDISSQCHLMDLTLSKEAMWSEIRQSAKSIINQGLKAYEFKVFNHENFTYEVGERHRILHHKCSGRVTRPLETFTQMSSWICNGAGLMFEQTFQGQVVQMIIVALGKGTACGASIADDPDFIWKIPMSHSLTFFIYEELKRLGYHYYEVGETNYRSNIFHMISEKERSICDFKRGFGKRSFPLKRWAWFESRDEEIRFLVECLDKYRTS